jgi:uroporphyrin-III C-methyltransferase/precorrin-2 dehydrogenase/sirohydrochlorin ferrochelatase
MAPLACLPLFIDLRGRRTVVAGGNEAAAWKVELLAAAGAQVDVYAPEAGPALVEVLARCQAQCVLWPRAWRQEDLAGVALAVADAADEAEAVAFVVAARAGGAIANVIDRPDHGSVTFGAIVNRSPVVVGISTHGAAPVLGQTIRRKIEVLLPPALGAWAALAKALRATIRSRWPAAEQRRAVWERFAERAFIAGPKEASPEAELAALAPTGVRTGHVTLVGAGPGDAGLLTLKAVRALQSADVILCDDLVSDDVLELARREAKRMLVGKRGGRASCRQDEITALMIKLARQGKRVVRLKSGDPMIFGRAGEEIEALHEAGIAVEVVPGITAALAMASALGVSLTHRDHARSLRLVTGHGRDGGMPPDLDWRGLADPTTTVVFYMGGRTAGTLMQRLLVEGMAADTPVSVVAGVSRSDGQARFGALADLPALTAACDPAQPVLIGIGRVFARRATADQPDLVLAAAG